MSAEGAAAAVDAVDLEAVWRPFRDRAAIVVDQMNRRLRANKTQQKGHLYGREAGSAAQAPDSGEGRQSESNGKRLNHMRLIKYQLRSSVVIAVLSFVILGLTVAGCRKLRAAVQDQRHSVTISWSPSTSPVTGYNVYRATKTGGPYTKLNFVPASTTRYTDTAVDAGHTYFYVVTSVDPRSVESPQSKEVAATVPRS